MGMEPFSIVYIEMASQWHVRNTLPNKPWLAPTVPRHSKVSNWMPVTKTRRNTNQYSRWAAPRNNGTFKFEPIDRSGWNTPKPKKGWLWGGKTRKYRKTRNNRSRKYRR